MTISFGFQSVQRWLGKRPAFTQLCSRRDFHSRRHEGLHPAFLPSSTAHPAEERRVNGTKAERMKRMQLGSGLEAKVARPVGCRCRLRAQQWSASSPSQSP